MKREEDGKIYYRITRKAGRIETNLLEWGIKGDSYCDMELWGECGGE